MLLGLAIVAAVLVPVRSSAAPSVLPGDDFSTSIGSCTLGFVFDGGGHTYFVSAAHCFDHIGENAVLDDGSVIGHLAAIGSADNTNTDWSLIEVSASRVADVGGAVRGHADMPRAVTHYTNTAIGDLIQHSGYGIPWFVDATLREKRVGVLTGDDDKVWISIGPDTWGDSGGPVMHRSSKTALGLVSRLCTGVCTSEGPTIEGILPQASAAVGFPLTLRTV